MGSYFRDEGWNSPRLLQWEHKVLTTGPSGKCLEPYELRVLPWDEPELALWGRLETLALRLPLGGLSVPGVSLAIPLPPPSASLFSIRGQGRLGS